MVAVWSEQIRPCKFLHQTLAGAELEVRIYQGSDLSVLGGPLYRYSSMAVAVAAISLMMSFAASLDELFLHQRDESFLCQGSVHSSFKEAAVHSSFKEAAVVLSATGLFHHGVRCTSTASPGTSVANALHFRCALSQRK